jgi:hypothetical protein
MYPKKYIDGLRLRNKAIGKELRRNSTKKILENGTPFPKELEYKDIDDAFKNYVVEDLNMEYDGTILPTFTLFSNQRIGEYSQTWKYTDSMNNIIMNFKTISRENNPQKGKIYGDQFNIPGNIRFPLFTVPVLQENGQMGYDMYYMKQPMPIDLIYTINIITNKYELLNSFNEKVNDSFKSLQKYIFPNDHPISMVLDSISDESSYNIDDRKFYSQAYKITVRGYIISKDDFEVEHTPSRILLAFDGDSTVNKHNKSKKIDYYEDPCRVIEDTNKFFHKIINLRVYFNQCEETVEFISDTNMVITSLELDNVFHFILYINGECHKMEDIENVEIKNGDSVRIKISKDDYGKETSILTICGYDKDKIVDMSKNPEIVTDDNRTEEIHVNEENN